MSGSRTRRPLTIFAAGGLLMLATLVAGVMLLVVGGPDGTRADLSAAAPTEQAAAPEPGPTKAPSPKKNRCWDGKEVTAKQRCDVYTEKAQFHAFGLNPDQCREGHQSGHARWSRECRVRGVDVHLATYERGSRPARLAAYGPRQDLGNGRFIAGGPGRGSGRWIRSYDDASAHYGLLMYASVDGSDPYNREVLLGLQQRFADALLHGEPITGE